MVVLGAGIAVAAEGFRPVAGGQIDEVRLTAECGELRLTALPGGIAFALGLTPPRPARQDGPGLLGSRLSAPGAKPEAQPIEGHIVLLDFVGADPAVQPMGQVPRPLLLNHYAGRDRSRWLESRACYGEVVYRGLWPGVDLVLRPEGGRLAYEWRGSADVLGHVAVRWRGATDIAQVDGNEVVSTPHGTLIVSPALGSALTGWISPAEEAVPAGPVATLAPQPATKDLDRMVWSTFLGGWSWDESYAVVSNGVGLTFLTGYTQSLDYPTIPGTAIVLGFTNVIVTALDEESGFPVWSTVLSGENTNEGRGIAMLPNGNVVVVGRTYSVDFPTTPGVQDSTVSASGSSFIAELEAQTGRFVWCTLLDDGWALSVAAASEGAVVLAGIVSSPYLPTTVGTFQPTHRGGYFDGFVARISNQGRALDWCTYLGSSDEDYVSAVGLDDQGRPVAGGFTGLDFPVTPGSYDTHCDGLGAGFVTKLTADGRQFVLEYIPGRRRHPRLEDWPGRSRGGGRRYGLGDVPGHDRRISDQHAGHRGRLHQYAQRGRFELAAEHVSGWPHQDDELEGLSLPPGGGILVCGRTWGPTFPGPLGPDQFAVPGVNAARPGAPERLRAGTLGQRRLRRERFPAERSSRGDVYRGGGCSWGPPGRPTSR